MSQNKSDVPGTKDPAPFKLTTVVTQDNEQADADTGDTLHAVCMAWNSSSGQYDIPVVGARVTFTPADGLFLRPDQPKTRADGTTEDTGAYAENPGKYKVDASAHGGKPVISDFVNADPVYVTFVANSQDTTSAKVDVLINPPAAEGKPYTVSAHCYLSPDDGSGAQDPSVGAYVTFAGGKNAANLTFVPSGGGTTNSDGICTVDVYASVVDQYQITATASGGDPQMPPNSTGSASRMIAPVYMLKITPPSGTLFADGYTTAAVTARFSIQPNDEPVQGATVTFDPVKELKFMSAASGLTDEKGEFTVLVTCAKDGTYTLTATGDIGKPNADNDGKAEGQAQIVFLPAPAYNLVLTSNQKAGGTAADGVTDVTVTATCYKQETDGSISYIQGAEIDFSGPEVLKIHPSSGQTLGGICLTSIVTRTDGRYDVNAHAVGGTGSPQIPQQGIDAKALTLIFTAAGEDYFDLDSNQGKDIPPADGHTPYSLTAYCYQIPLNSQKEQGLRGVEINFDPVDGLVFSQLSGRTGSDGKLTIGITSTEEGEHTVSAKATIGGGTLPLPATTQIRFGEYDEDVQVGLEFAGSVETATIYANGENQAVVLVHWSIVDTDGIDAIEAVELVTTDNDSTNLNQKGWTIHDTFTDPAYQPGPFTKTVGSGKGNQAADTVTSATSGLSSARRSPANKGDPHGTGTYYFYLSTDGSTAVSPQKFRARLQYKTVWYYSTENNDETLGDDEITLSYLDAENYTAASFGVEAHAGPNSGEDDDNNRGQPQKDWLWRQVHFRISLDNKNELYDYDVPSGFFTAEDSNNIKSTFPALCTTKLNNSYTMELYAWPLGQGDIGEVYLWRDYGCPMTVKLIEGEGIKFTIIALVRKVWGSGQTTYFPTGKIRFRDKYGNIGYFYLNCNLPSTYNDLMKAVGDVTVYQPMSSGETNTVSTWYWSGYWKVKDWAYLYRTNDEVESGTGVYKFRTQANVGPTASGFYMGSGYANHEYGNDNTCPLQVIPFGNYNNFKGLRPCAVWNYLNEGDDKDHLVWVVANTYGTWLPEFWLWVTPIWNKGSFRYSVNNSQTGNNWYYAKGIYGTGENDNSYILFTQSFGSGDDSYSFSFENGDQGGPSK